MEESVGILAQATGAELAALFAMLCGPGFLIWRMTAPIRQWRVEVTHNLSELDKRLAVLEAHQEGFGREFGEVKDAIAALDAKVMRLCVEKGK